MPLKPEAAPQKLLANRLNDEFGQSYIRKLNGVLRKLILRQLKGDLRKLYGFLPSEETIQYSSEETLSAACKIRFLKFAKCFLENAIGM